METNMVFMARSMKCPSTTWCKLLSSKDIPVMFLWIRMTLEELPGNRTKATIYSVFQSVSDRDGMIQNGMEKGVSEGYERLDDILEAM